MDNDAPEDCLTHQAFEALIDGGDEARAVPNT